MINENAIRGGISITVVTTIIFSDGHKKMTDKDSDKSYVLGMSQLLPNGEIRIDNTVSLGRILSSPIFAETG